MKFLNSRLSILVRYPAAIIVAYVVSCITAILCFIIGVPILSISFFSLARFEVPVGFCGVFFGALCLRKCNRPFYCNRVFGSFVLLALGLSYEILTDSPSSETHNGPVSPRAIIATGIGGLIAAVLHYWRMPTTTGLEPTATASLVSDAVNNPQDGSKPKLNSNGRDSA
jgi:hypothetical protein